MSISFLSRAVGPLFLLLAATDLSAQAAADPALVRLRDALKNTMLQLRTAQTEQSNLQANVASLEAEKTTLTAQNAALSKQAMTDKDASTRSIEDLESKNTAQEKQLAAQTDAIEKWKIALQNMTVLAQKTEAERARQTARAIVLDRQVADQKIKNAEMYRLGCEILTRYEKFGLGDALTAREPFVGLTRVKFENLVQDYSDKIADQKIKP